MDNAGKLLVTEREAAEMLGVRPRTLQAYRLSGGGAPFVKLGRLVRYRISDLEAWAAEHLRTSTSDRGN
jgi:excisionase family DNA binding protein